MQDDFIELVQNRDHEVEELLTSILLCTQIHRHKGDSNGIPTVDPKADVSSEYYTNYIEENALLNLARSCEIDYIHSKKPGEPKDIQLKIHGDRKVYSTDAHANFLGQNGTYAVLVRNATLSRVDQGILYIKGPFEEVMKYINERHDSLPYFYKAEATMLAKGQLPYVVAKKILHPDDYQSFKDRCKNSKSYLNTQREFIHSLFNEHLIGMQPIAIIGLEQQYHTGAKRIVRKFQDAGITPWLVTRRDLSYALQIGRTLENINLDRAIYFNEEDPDLIKQDIRRQLNVIQTLYENEKRRTMQAQVQERLHTFTVELTKHLLRKLRQNTIIVSGKALDFIVRDSYCRDNFAFLVAVSGGLMAFNASPDNKSELVKLIKEKIAERPQVMAIGSSYSDVLMMNTADVGICVSNKRSSNVPVADLVVSDINNLDKLLLHYGMRFSQQIDSMIYHLYYRSILFILPQFYFNWYASNTGTSIFGSLIIFLFNFLFTLLPALSLSTDYPISKAYIDAFPGLYAEGKSKKQYLTRKFVLRAAMEGFLHSLCLFYLAVYIIEKTITTDGDPASLGLVAFGIYFPVQMVANTKVPLPHEVLSPYTIT